MLRTVGGGAPTLWESILPPAVLGMPDELERVDRLLDDPRFVEPYRAFFHATLGRPSIPIETYLRLMFLKYRHRLSFESLCAEVSDSITWQRFARIPLGGRVPHPSTLMKITTRCGEDVIRQLNETLVVKAAEAKVLRLHKVRADTTVVEANVAYPVDSSLLAKGITRLARLARAAQAQGLATRTRVRDRSRRAHRRARQVVNALRRRGDDARVEVHRLNAELARAARRSVREAHAVVRNAHRTLRALGDQASARAEAIVQRLEVLADRVGAVAAQTIQRVVKHVTPAGATRVVSLHDPDARPIRKGRLGRPVEFGYKAQVLDNADGIILDWTLEVGNPADAPQLVPAIQRVQILTGRTPRAVTADRGYGEAAVDAQLRELGVTQVCIPRKGRPGAHRRAVEHSRSFQRMTRWRTGAEGRINCIKRDYGARRTHMDSLTGARTWTGHGILAHNLTKISGLIG
jgi:transposase, IS5 family